MPNQIVLAWTVDVTGSPLGPAGAATALGAVPLYMDPTTDPVLGQNFGLTVAGDVFSPPGVWPIALPPLSASQAGRVLTLNMTAVPGAPTAPPPFPCHPLTSTLPVLPYPLRETVTLAGSFFVATGATVIPTTATQLPALVTGSVIQFLAQQGVFYTVAAGTTSTSINLTTPYTGPSRNTEAFKEIAAPAKLTAIYSTSALDTAAIDFEPLENPGPGARSVSLSYLDSLGAAGTVVVPLSGKFPAAVVLAGGTIDIETITAMSIASTGGFANSVGQITLAELSGPLPQIPDPEDNTNAITAFLRVQDEAQLLLKRPLVYLPPSYFALAQQGASTPQLAGDFILTTGQISVPTTVDQTAALAAGNVICFAEQQAMDNRQLPVDVLYVIAAVSPKYVTLTRPFTGLDNTNTGTNQVGTNANAGTKGNMGSELQKKPSGAFLITPSPAASPTNTQLAGPLGQFVDPGNAAPPLNPPLVPATMTPAMTAAPGAPPNVLSGLFTRTLQLALAGVPVVAQPITFI
jgi:hypothetical protein